MRAAEPQGLGMQRWASLVLALLLMGMELGWALLAAFNVAKLELGAGGAWRALLLSALMAVANTWALARVIKSGHFLWLFSRWPQPPMAQPVLDQAWSAFDDGDLERVVMLAGKDVDAGTRQFLRRGAGLSLALLGRMTEAADALEGLEERAPQLQWLRPRRAWGKDRPPYFKPYDAVWARRQFWITLFTLFSITAWFVFADLVHGGTPIPEALRAFDSASFETLEDGPFVIHYHDAAAAQELAGLAEKALAAELAFLGRENAEIGRRSFQLYLCDDRAEYLKRTPMAPVWEEASAVPSQNSLYVYKHPPEEHIYFEVVVAHELSHLLYRRFIPVHKNDAWLNEGLADFQGYAFALDRAGFPRQAWLSEHAFAKLAQRSLPFGDFFEIDPYEIKDPNDVGIFYRQGFSIVFLLVEHYGRKDFLRFLDNYRLANGNATAALAATYPTIQNTSELAAVWGLFYGHGH
jgi:hypothetical protein